MKIGFGITLIFLALNTALALEKPTITRAKEMGGVDVISVQNEGWEIVKDQSGLVYLNSSRSPWGLLKDKDGATVKVCYTRIANRPFVGISKDAENLKSVLDLAIFDTLASFENPSIVCRDLRDVIGRNPEFKDLLKFAKSF